MLVVDLVEYASWVLDDAFRCPGRRAEMPAARTRAPSNYKFFVVVVVEVEVLEVGNLDALRQLGDGHGRATSGEAA